jgi:CubicO group peptidase (beta-lactamase class C family)
MTLVPRNARTAINRRSAVLGTGAFVMSQPAHAAMPAWPVATLDAAGFAADMGDKLDAGVRSGLLRGLHTVVVTRAGKLVFEKYYDGLDQAWGRSLGMVKFGPDTLHDLRSVTKSLVGLLYGIALARGQVPQLDAPLLQQFPEYPDLANDPQRAAITIEHVITMTMGTDWNEQLPYSDPNNSEIMMENAADRYRFVLDRPMLAAPGTKWVYNGGSTALLGRLIAKGTGKSLPEFARDALFTPLSISPYEWATGGDGVASAASGLRLSSRDLARIGNLVLANGQFSGQQVVPATWITAMRRPAVSTGDGLHYSRGWYHGAAPVATLTQTPSWLAGFGNGGQRLWLMPDIGVAAVIFAGNYNTADQWVLPTRVWREIILANLQRP